MKTILKYIKNTVLLMLVAGFSLITSCSEDDVLDTQQGSGMVQFRLYKESLITTKATTTLDKLYDAKKIRVALRDESNNVFMQSLELEAYDEETAEYGITSEKLALLPGNYKFTSFTLYNAKNEEIQSDELSYPSEFTIVAGGLVKHIVAVDATVIGKVRFLLKKNIVPSTKATSEKKEDSFPFRVIKQADITVKNLATNREIQIENVNVTYLEDFESTEVGAKLYAFARFDSIISLPAGTYSVVKYDLTNSSGSASYTKSEDVAKNEFTVADFNVLEADVPVRISEMADNVQDGIVLHAIWEALDGENWSYVGENYPKGTNWNFNKDIDTWGEQPGINLNSEGRITNITIGNFGPRGAVPDEIGKLTELTTLVLGQLSDFNGNFAQTNKQKLNNQRLAAAEIRGEFVGNEYYLENFVRIDPMSYFSEALQRGIAEEKNEVFELAAVGIPDLMPKVGIYTNQITSISEEIGKLTKLTEFCISNSPITKLPDALANLPNLTDVQVGNCPNMTKFPMVLTKLPKLVALNMALNPQLSNEEMLAGLDALAQFEGAKEKQTIQLLYLSYNKLKTLPESFSMMTRLGGLDCSNCEIETLPVLGQDVSPVQLYFNNNKLHTIEVDENGNYCDMEDLEEINLSNNQLKSFPDIFSAKSLYQVTTIDLSYNLIEDFITEKGVYVVSLILAGNRLKTFPSSLFDSGSIITYLSLVNNQINSFPENVFDGKYSYMMTTLDLTRNHLSKIPVDFNNRKLPYLTGLDLSYNQFESFPYQPFNIATLSIFGLRYQRNEDGYRCMKEFPTSLYTHKGARAIWLGGNDIGKVPSGTNLGPYWNMLDISDNPNLQLNISALCSRIGIRTFQLIYDSTQDITGCSYLTLE